MRYLKYAALLGFLFLAASSVRAQVRVGVGVGIGPGPEPVCAYGYYPYYPYACAHYGYWTPNYFVNGVFVGVGPWYHAHWHAGYGGPRYGYYGRAGYYRGIRVHGRYGHEGFHGGGFHGSGFRGGHR